ncbi:MAG: hypothetical protein CMJ18_16980 [Phycisphaeraceae bacterium]|nr:hypothetical protein [Phycisphaeraceae bacterium]
MQRGADVVPFGVVNDPLRLDQAAGEAQVRLDQVHPVPVDQRVEPMESGQALAAGDRDARPAPQLDVAVQVGVGQRLFVEAQATRRQSLGDLDRFTDLDRLRDGVLVAVEGEVEVPPEPVAQHVKHLPHAVEQVRVGDIDGFRSSEWPIGSAQTLVEVVRKLRGAIAELRVRRDLLLVALDGPERRPSGSVHRHRVPHGSSEKLAHRDTERLARQVPQRQLETADHAAPGAFA